MSGFDELKNNNERKFVLEAQQEFKAEARRNKHLALWAADLFKFDDVKTKAYILEVITSDMEEAGDDDVFRKMKADFESRGVEMSDVALREKMNEFLEQAREEVFKEG